MSNRCHCERSRSNPDLTTLKAWIASAYAQWLRAPCWSEPSDCGVAIGADPDGSLRTDRDNMKWRNGYHAQTCADRDNRGCGRTEGSAPAITQGAWSPQPEGRARHPSV